MYHWHGSKDPKVLRAYAWNGESLWLEVSTGRGFILQRGQTVWESETAGTTARVECEAERLGLRPAPEDE